MNDLLGVPAASAAAVSAPAQRRHLDALRTAAAPPPARPLEQHGVSRGVALGRLAPVVAPVVALLVTVVALGLRRGVETWSEARCGA